MFHFTLTAQAAKAQRASKQPAATPFFSVKRFELAI